MDIYELLKEKINNVFNEIKAKHQLDELRDKVNNLIEEYNNSGGFESYYKMIKEKKNQNKLVLYNNLETLVKKELGIENLSNIGINFWDEGKMINPELWKNSFKYSSCNDSRNDLHNRYPGYYNLSLIIWVNEYEYFKFLYNQNYNYSWRSGKVYMEFIHHDNKLINESEFTDEKVIGLLSEILKNPSLYIKEGKFNLSEAKVNIIIGVMKNNLTN